MNLQKIKEYIHSEYGNCDIDINLHGVDAELMLRKNGMDAVNGKVGEMANGIMLTVYSADYLPFAPREKTHFGGGIVE
jgi:hypothetical protein